MIGTRLLVALGLVAGLAGAVPAHAADPDGPVYCDAGDATGSITYGSGLTSSHATSTYTMTVTARCLAGTGDDAGTYAFTITGSEDGDCATGTSDGASVSVTGPEGAGTGTASFTRPDLHYYVDGGWNDGTEVHTFQLWMDYTRGCPFESSDLIGHGTIWDHRWQDVVTGPPCRLGGGLAAPGATLSGGPLAVTAAPDSDLAAIGSPLPAVNLELTCTVGTVPYAADLAVAVATMPLGAVVLPPTSVTFSGPPVPAHLCTRLRYERSGEQHDEQLGCMVVVV